MGRPTDGALLLAFAFGCNMGCSVVVSRLFGAKKYKEMKAAVSTACIFTGFVYILLMDIGIAGTDMMPQGLWQYFCHINNLSFASKIPCPSASCVYQGEYHGRINEPVQKVYPIICGYAFL